MSDYGLHLRPEDWAEIMNRFKRRPLDMFHIHHVRVMVAQRRAEVLGLSKQFDGNPENAVDETIPHNKLNMEHFVESHVVRLLRPLSIIDPVYKEAGSLSVLSIGPRNEMEIFHLMAMGFLMRNIQAIDLVSNSPFIQVADMHDTPFEDSRFDVAVSGWALPYSKDHQKAVDEMVRVLKPGGLFCMGFTRIPPEDGRAKKVADDGSINHAASDEILDLIGRDNIEEVAFRHDPLDKSQDGAILLIVRIKK